MTACLQLVVRCEEGVLVRVLGLIVRRGFAPVSMDAAIHDARWRINVSVTGERSVEVLGRQLERLDEVEQVRVLVAEVEGR